MISVNSVLNKRYKIIRLIGSGGTAYVYLAKDLILDREVAIKVLRYDVIHDEKILKRFYKEARAISELGHNNIVSLYDVDNDGDIHYLVMEYVDGMDLKKYIRENYPLNINTVVNIMEQITQAVYVAHQHGIIHRDLKPQNILLTTDGTIKITDFGIATSLNDISITQTNTLVGSIHYLAPEQARGQSATSRSDIYSLGIMMYELIVGNVPFNGDTPVSIAMKHFQQTIPSIINQSRQFVPQSVENVVLKATAKSPENRYSSAKEMYNDLKNSLLVSDKNVLKYVEPTSLESPTVHTMPTQSLQNNIENVIKKSENKRKKWVIGAIIVPIIAVIAILIMVLFNAKDVTIPNVTGLTQTEAVKKVTDLGLIVDKIDYKEDEKIEKDKVITITPNIDTVVKKNTKVTLTISSGVSGKEVLDYRNKTYDEAYLDLTSKGFIVEKKVESSTIVNEGKIVSQSLTPGTKITAKNQVITLVVSTGSITILDYTNQSYTKVKAELESKGVSVQLREERENDTVVSGNIISQSVAPNTKIIAGQTTISFVVSVGQGITMENVVNQNANTVKSQLEAKSINVTIIEQESNSIASGNVISQNVLAGTKLSKGSTVTLTVSKGTTTKMPNLLGSSQTFAQQQLESLGVIVVLISEPSSTYAKGTISKQSVLAGSAIVSNMTVTLTVSSGTAQGSN